MHDLLHFSINHGIFGWGKWIHTNPKPTSSPASSWIHDRNNTVKWYKQVSLKKWENNKSERMNNRINKLTRKAHPVKLGVVQSTTRSWSSSILKKGQFSHPDSLNCYSKNPSPDKETAKRTERKERNSSKHYLIICLNESASKTCSQLMTKASRYLSRLSCATHSPNSCFYEPSLPLL